MKYKPISKDDKARRPYAVCIDWLQIYCHQDGHFVENGTNCWGYTTKQLDHGSKYWKKIFDVFDPDGELVGQVTSEPHKQEVNKLSCMFKADNAILYEADAIDRVLAAIQGLGLQTVCVTRIDLAYDCNTFYNGLHPATLVAGYMQDDENKQRYVKVGQNDFLLYASMGYHGDDSTGSFNAVANWEPKRTKKQKEAHEKEVEQRRRDCEAVGMPADEPQAPKILSNIPAFKVGSITWGMRSSAVQVQLYDKSRELRSVKMKHHIVHRWKAAGIDITKQVYRLEIRITNRGKTLQNFDSKKFLQLSINDIQCQEQVEQLLYDYAEKYFKFYIADGHKKIQNSQRLRLLSLCNDVVLNPKNTSFAKDYTRGTCIALHVLDKHIVANERAGNDVAEVLKQAREYIEDAHGLHKQETHWMADDLRRAGLEKGMYDELTPEKYFALRLQGADDALISKAAESWHRTEANLRRQRELLEERHADHLRNGGTEESWESMIGTRYEVGDRIAEVEITALSPLLPPRERLSDLFESESATMHHDFLRRMDEMPTPPPLTQEQIQEARERERRLWREKFDPIREVYMPIDDCPF